MNPRSPPCTDFVPFSPHRTRQPATRREDRRLVEDLVEDLVDLIEPHLQPDRASRVATGHGTVIQKRVPGTRSCPVKTLLPAPHCQERNGWEVRVDLPLSGPTIYMSQRCHKRTIPW